MALSFLLWERLLCGRIKERRTGVLLSLSEWRDSFASAPLAQIEVRLRRAVGGNARPRCIWNVRVSHYSKRKNAGMALSHSCIFGPSGETRTRGILLPKTSRKLCIFYSLFLASYFIKPLISSNFRSHRFFYFRSISGQISGHKSALPSKRNRSST